MELERTETGLLKDGKKFSGTLLNFQQPVNIADFACKGFFANHIKAGFHSFDGNIHMPVTAAAVDYQFHIFIFQQIFIIRVMSAFRIGFFIAVDPSFRNRVCYGDHVKTFLQRCKTLKQMPMDVSSAAPLTDDADFYAFHLQSPFD